MCCIITSLCWSHVHFLRAKKPFGLLHKKEMIMISQLKCRLVVIVFKDIAIGAEGLGFDS